MAVDHLALEQALQAKLANAGSADAKELLLLSKALESYSGVYTLKDIAEAVAALQTYINVTISDAADDADNARAAQTDALNALIQAIDDKVEGLPISQHTSDPTAAGAEGIKKGHFWINESTGLIWLCQKDTGGDYGWVALGAGKSINIPKYGHTFTTPGTHTYTVPDGVYEISAVAVGAGGGGHTSWSNRGGGGGALAYATFNVTPGEEISITVPPKTPQGTHGADAVVGAYFSAGGGRYAGYQDTQVAVPKTGTVMPLGGKGGLAYSGSGGGGGGAGGYFGQGGNGCYGTDHNTSYGTGNSSPDAGSGAGGGGGGYNSSTYGFGGGGGVGIYGFGPDGAGVTSRPSNTWQSSASAGGGGSNGEKAVSNTNSTNHGSGGKYGGGAGGGGTSISSSTDKCNGGQGAVRIICGPNTGYPFNAAKLPDEVIV